MIWGGRYTAPPLLEVSNLFSPGKKPPPGPGPRVRPPAPPARPGRAGPARPPPAAPRRAPPPPDRRPQPPRPTRARPGPAPGRAHRQARGDLGRAAVAEIAPRLRGSLRHLAPSSPLRSAPPRDATHGLATAAARGHKGSRRGGATERGRGLVGESESGKEVSLNGEAGDPAFRRGDVSQPGKVEGREDPQLGGERASSTREPASSTGEEAVTLNGAKKGGSDPALRRGDESQLGRGEVRAGSSTRRGGDHSPGQGQRFPTMEGSDRGTGRRMGRGDRSQQVILNRGVMTVR